MAKSITKCCHKHAKQYGYNQSRPLYGYRCSVCGYRWCSLCGKDYKREGGDAKKGNSCASCGAVNGKEADVVIVWTASYY